MTSLPLTLAASLPSGREGIHRGKAVTARRSRESKLFMATINFIACQGELIRAGRVKVNDEVVRDLGVKVDPEVDRVEVNGREIKPVRKRYIALNKPRRILHPRYRLPKTYLALVKGRVLRNTVRRMLEGAELEDGFTRPDRVRIVEYKGGNTLLEVVFHEGRKHIVKRFLARFGHPVLQLKRIAVGPVKLGKLGPGRWRDLTPSELRRLFSAVGLKYNP